MHARSINNGPTSLPPHLATASLTTLSHVREDRGSRGLSWCGSNVRVSLVWWIVVVEWVSLALARMCVPMVLANGLDGEAGGDTATGME